MGGVKKERLESIQVYECFDSIHEEEGAWVDDEVDEEILKRKEEEDGKSLQ